MKANPKMKAEPKVEVVATGGGKKKMMIIIIIAAVVVLALGGGGAWFFMHGKSDEAPGKSGAKHKEASKGPPNYVAIDPFTVNLQPGESGADQYLQLAFTLEVPSLEDVENIKNNNAKVRSRLLLLLSGKHAADINTPDGKKQLASEILAQVKEPFEDKGTPQEVTDVLFTSFIIQ